MTKTANLERSWVYGRKIYGPGENLEIPDELYEILEDKALIGNSGDAVEQDEGLFDGLSDEQVANLEASGYGSPEAIRMASEEDLIAVDEIGPATAKKLKERADG